MVITGAEILHISKKEVDVSSEWQESTTVQMKAARRQALEELRLRLIGEQGRMLPLRDVLDLVLDAGLASLSESSMGDGAGPGMAGNGAEMGRSYA